MAKNISTSVGQGGANSTSNVLTIQYLLNCVPAGFGGPVTELAVDGLLGPKTVAAILKFQKAIGGIADGRVDPNGGTLKALQQYDPYPGTPYVSPGQKTGGMPNQKIGGIYGDKAAGLPGQKVGGYFGEKAAGMPGIKSTPGYKSW